MALSYYDLGRYGGAAEQYEHIIRAWPNNPKGHFLLTKTLIMAGQYDKALSRLNQALVLAPKSIKETLELGDLLAEKGASSQAKQAYQEALNRDPENEEAKKKLADF